MTSRITKQRHPLIDFVRSMGQCVESSGPDMYVKKGGGIQFVERPGRFYFKRGGDGTLHSTFVEHSGFHRLVTLLQKIWLRLCGYQKVTGTSTKGPRALFFKKDDPFIPEFIRHVEHLSGVDCNSSENEKLVVDVALRLLIDKLTVTSGFKYPELTTASDKIASKLFQQPPSTDDDPEDLTPPFD